VTELGAMRVDLVDFVVVRRSLSSWMRLRRGPEVYRCSTIPGPIVELDVRTLDIRNLSF
jgi:hypothetical protein